MESIYLWTIHTESVHQRVIEIFQPGLKWRTNITKPVTANLAVIDSDMLTYLQLVFTKKQWGYLVLDQVRKNGSRCRTSRLSSEEVICTWRWISSVTSGGRRFVVFNELNEQNVTQRGQASTVRDVSDIWNMSHISFPPLSLLSGIFQWLLSPRSPCG